MVAKIWVCPEVARLKPWGQLATLRADGIQLFPDIGVEWDGQVLSLQGTKILSTSEIENALWAHPFEEGELKMGWGGSTAPKGSLENLPSLVGFGLASWEWYQRGELQKTLDSFLLNIAGRELWELEQIKLEILHSQVALEQCVRAVQIDLHGEARVWYQNCRTAWDFEELERNFDRSYTQATSLILEKQNVATRGSLRILNLITISSLGLAAISAPASVLWFIGEPFTVNFPVGVLYLIWTMVVVTSMLLVANGLRQRSLRR